MSTYTYMYVSLHTHARTLAHTQGLRNDHKAVMRVIEERLHKIHADTRLQREAGLGGPGGGREGERALPTTFARVTQVTEGSPSATAVRGSWSQ